MKLNNEKRLSIWAIVIIGVLLIPAVTSAPWTASDYIFAGVVLSGCAIAYETATKNMTSIAHKVAVAAIVLAFIGLVMGWAASGP